MKSVNFLSAMVNCTCEQQWNNRQLTVTKLSYCFPIDFEKNMIKSNKSFTTELLKNKQTKQKYMKGNGLYDLIRSVFRRNLSKETCKITHNSSISEPVLSVSSCLFSLRIVMASQQKFENIFGVIQVRTVGIIQSCRQCLFNNMTYSIDSIG